MTWLPQFPPINKEPNPHPRSPDSCSNTSSSTHAAPQIRSQYPKAPPMISFCPLWVTLGPQAKEEMGWFPWDLHPAQAWGQPIKACGCNSASSRGRAHTRGFSSDLREIRTSHPPLRARMAQAILLWLGGEWSCPRRQTQTKKRKSWGFQFWKLPELGEGGGGDSPLLPADSDQCLEKIPASADRQTWHPANAPCEGWRTCMSAGSRVTSRHRMLALRKSGSSYFSVLSTFLQRAHVNLYHFKTLPCRPLSYHRLTSYVLDTLSLTF